MAHLLSYVVLGFVGLAGMAQSPVYAIGTSDNSATDAKDYDAAKAMIDDKKDYAGALPVLEAVTKAQPNYADAWNLRGFANRKLGNMDEAAAAYDTALKLNPKHLGALEYQGEMFIQTGKIDMAKANLTKLQAICGSCEEAEDLEKSLTAVGG